jgi:hypothetical protein
MIYSPSVVILAIATLATTVVLSATGSASASTWSRPGRAAIVTGSLYSPRGLCRRSPTSVTGVCLRALPDRTGRVAHNDASLGASTGTRPAGLSSPRSLPSPPAACEFGTGQPIVNASRFLSCTDTDWELWTDTIISGVTEITGSLNFEDRQWNTYNTGDAPATWVHGLNIMILQGVGTLLEGTTADVDSTCGGANSTCDVSTDLGGNGQNVDLIPNTSYDNAWVEEDTGPASTSSGQIDVQDSLGITLSGSGGPGIPPWTFTDADLVGRCDSVATVKDHCINQDVIPTLTLSLAAYGAAAAIIQWAQTNLSAHWGVDGEGQPLHYLSNSALNKQNRKIICKTNWKASAALNTALKPYDTTDSCDEFPFAGSYESGAMMTGWNGQKKKYVTTGKDCAQVTAVKTDDTGVVETDWSSVSPLGSYSSSQVCVRGHIPASLNSKVGTAYSKLLSNDRVLGAEPFWLTVSS